MKVLHRYGGAPRVVKPVHGLEVKEADDWAVEDEEQHEGGHSAHHGSWAEVALAVVGGAKHRNPFHRTAIPIFPGDATKHLHLQNWKGALHLLHIQYKLLHSQHNI